MDENEAFEPRFILYTIQMTKEEIYHLLRQLARSQWCWWRLLYDWQEAGCTDEALEELEAMDFKSWLDLILFLEGNA